MGKELFLMDKICRFVSKQINKDIAFPQLHIFILVAMNQGITQPELVDILKVPQGTVSRNVIKLGNQTVQNSKGIWKQVGYGLIEQKQDLDEPRRSAVFLTRKGMQIAMGLSEIIKEGASIGKLSSKNK